jgi:hypothetical protein
MRDRSDGWVCQTLALALPSIVVGLTVCRIPDIISRILELNQ